MEAYRSGDDRAFRQLFERYSTLLVRVIRTSRISEDTARDLVQQTFLQLHRARADYQSGAPLRPWLMTIAYNLKRDYLRRSSRRQELPLDPEQHAASATTGNEASRRPEDELVRLAVSRLAEKQRAVIELHWFGELSFKEIAHVLGIGESAAKVRAHRAYKELRELVEALQRAPAAVTAGTVAT